MSAMSVVRQVAWREIKTRMMTKANIISMAVMLAVIVIAAVAGNYFLDRAASPEATQVAVESPVAGLRPFLTEAAERQGLDLELTDAAGEDAAALLDDGAMAVLRGTPARPTVVTTGEPDQALVAVITAATQSFVVTEQIDALGGDPATFTRALAGAVPTVEQAEDAGPGFDGPTYGISMVMISILLFALIGSGSLIAMGVVEEKTSRVVELLLATIRPAQLLAGKILGIGVYGLAQVVVLGGAVTAAAAALGLTDGMELSLGSALGWLLVWFLLGYALYALLFGGFAALVSRQEDIGSVTTPLMFLLFIPFYATMFLVPGNPDGTLVRIVSQIPIFSPFMMPVRDAFGAVGAGELALAIGLCLVTIPLLVALAARVYQRGVLHTGGRMKLRDALRASA
ncbi:MAG: ABC transporter permease [Georgenia sp.]